MLRSMTGFGAGEAVSEEYRVQIEVKAVNQRFLETDFRMPRVLDSLAEAMKGKIREYASRGKLTVSVQFEDKRERPREIRVDKNLAIAYHKALEEISDSLRLARPSTVLEIASYPGVLTTIEPPDDMAGAGPLLLAALDEAMGRFVAMRETEGANLAADFLRRLKKLEDMVEEVAGLGPEIVQRYRDRLEKTLSELLAASEIDENRIIQETAIYADRVNYTEEIVRLRSHFQQFRSIIEAPAEPVGRKLEFLIQEMNREINTIASKANSTRATRITVEVKSEIEKLREQVQNVE